MQQRYFKGDIVLVNHGCDGSKIVGFINKARIAYDKNFLYELSMHSPFNYGTNITVLEKDIKTKLVEQNQE